MNSQALVMMTEGGARHRSLGKRSRTAAESAAIAQAVAEAAASS